MNLPRAGEMIDAVYRRGGWILVTRPAASVIAAVALAGIIAFAYLVAGRYGTPFVVAGRIGLGGLVFILGRLAIVVVHELAHGLVLTSYGRRVERAGFKLLLVFPYAFVDTSQAWMEPRRRRIAVSAAGPAADLALGAVFALACLVAPPGAQRDVLFQLAFAAYVGACFNLNPFLDRDGYQILVDLLREPNLRRRAREQFARRLAGAPAAGDSRLLARYSVLALAWSVVAAGFVVAMTLRYRERIDGGRARRLARVDRARCRLAHRPHPDRGAARRSPARAESARMTRRRAAAARRSRCTSQSSLPAPSICA